jgi:hypothetical protein
MYRQAISIGKGNLTQRGRQSGAWSLPQMRQQGLHVGIAQKRQRPERGIGMANGLFLRTSLILGELGGFFLHP